MPRTKTQAGIKKKKKQSVTLKKSETEGENSSRPKRLTVKQLRERRKLILEMIIKANNELIEEKKKHLNDNDQSARKVTFKPLVKFSNGEEKEVEFKDGETAKQLMGFNIQPTTIQIEPPVTRNKRKTDNINLVEGLELKRVKKNK